MKYLAKTATNLHWREERDTEGQTGEHKQAVEIGDSKNGIAVLAHESQHAIDWDGATVMRCTNVTGYWQRRATEAIHIDHNEHMGTMNLDSGLSCQQCGIPSSIHPNHHRYTQVIVIIIIMHQYYKYHYYS